MPSFSVLPENPLGSFPNAATVGCLVSPVSCNGDALTDSRVLAILRNPSYAGVYAFEPLPICFKEILEDGASPLQDRTHAARRVAGRDSRSVP